MAKRKPLRENVQRRPPWGATKATARKLAKEREHKNQIHDLATALADARVVIDNLMHAHTQLRRVLDAVAHPGHMSQLRLVIAMPFAEAKRLGLVEALVQLTSWHAELEGGVAENARQALEATDPERPGNVKTIPNAEPLMPRPSGIVKQRTDDDNDSVDDLFAKGVDVHLERMDKNYYWLGLEPVGANIVHIDIQWTKTRGLRAWVRK